MQKMLEKPVTAADVRDWFSRHPKMVPAGAEHTVAKSAKGRVHPLARQVFNAKSGKVYSEGTPKAQQPLKFYKIDSLGRRQPRTVMLPVAEIRALAGEVAGQRGRLSPEALQAAGEAYTKRVN